jgi:MinD-like ATPase involved in chromosome partitioning or flagellar assembly
MKLFGFHGLREGAGASFLAASSAFRMTVTNGRVLVVDAHPCASSLKRFFNLPMHVPQGWLEAEADASGSLPFWQYDKGLEILPVCGREGEKPDRPWDKRFEWLLERIGGLGFDAVVIDAGPVQSGASRALRKMDRVLSVTVTEPDASCLARLTEHEFGPRELLVLNKCNPASAAHKDVMLAMNRIEPLARRLVPISVPWDEFALEACLMKRPVTQGLAFAQSAESINNFVTWLEAYMRRDGAR